MPFVVAAFIVGGMRLKKYTLGMVLVLLMPVAALSEWVLVSLEVAVKNSDVIVVGTLREVSEETRDSVDYGRGVITVEEVLWGDVETGQRLTLVWQNSSNIDCPRVEHRPHENKQVIWLLTGKPEGRVAADNPGLVVAVGKKEKVVELLRARER